MKQPIEIDQAVSETLASIMSPAMQQQWAAAAMRPGLALVRTVLDLIEQHMSGASAPAKRGRPRADATFEHRSKANSGYWAKLTPQQRAAEMKRRALVAAGKAEPRKKEQRLHPRDASHPGHAAWVRKMRAAHKARWAGMSKAKKADWSRTMQAGRVKAVKKTPSVRLVTEAVA